MMAVIMAAYQNTSSSFFGAKFQKSIEEIFVSPMAYWKILLGFCAGAMLRAMIVA
jgi:ABC-2 type transport system permease protein